MNVARDIDQERKYVFYSLLRIFVLILLGSAMVYGLNSTFSRAAYYVLIVLIFFFSKETIFGVALLFILTLNPWGLFYTSPFDWIIPITSTVGIPYSISFTAIIFVKFLLKKEWRKQFITDYLIKFYRYFAFYIVFLLIWGLIFGHSNKSLYDLTTSIFVLSVFLVIPKIFDERKQVSFNRIIFGFCIIHAFFSMVDVISTGEISKILVFGRGARGPRIEGDLVRIFGGLWIALYCLILALYYLAKRKKHFNNYYLLLVILMSFITVLNSGARGWMLGSIFLLLFFIIYYFRRLITARFAAGTLIIIAASIIILPAPILKNIKESNERFLTIKTIAEGDMTAGGTAGRWNVRGPRVLTEFQESPIFGFGFSKITSRYYDAHVGNHTLLLMGGIVGLSIIWLTVISIIFNLYRIEKKYRNYYGIFVMGLGFLSIMIIHSTNVIMISFVRMPPASVFLIALLFNHINAQIHSFKVDRQQNELQRIKQK